MPTYDGYSWIKVKRFHDDPNLSWENRYRALERHHLEETTFLIEKVRELARQLEESAAGREASESPPM
jgi:hypothetical protein